jgi:hypothetical protein
MLLIYTPESDPTPIPEDEYLQRYSTLTQEMRDAGAFLGGDPLEFTDSSTTIRVRDGKTLTTDGPFAETKEQLGGYYIVEAKNLDEATAWAAKIPGALHGSIEVRPIRDFGG